MEIANHVVVFGGKEIDVPENLTVAEIKERAAQSEVSIVNKERETGKSRTILTKSNVTVIPSVGFVETVVGGVPVGLGSYVQWDRKLDARLAQAVVSINAFKGVEFGLGFEAGNRKGSQVMDEILWSKEDGYTSRTNNLGGFEGGYDQWATYRCSRCHEPIPSL